MSTDPSTSVTLEVQNSTIENLGANPEAAAESLASLALRQWTSLIFGQTRYRSLTELYLDWLREIFSEIDGTSEPTQGLLYANLSFPYGQAEYLARVLREDQPIRLRLRFLAELEEVLEGRREEAEDWDQKGRGTERMSIQISKSARRELDYLLGALIASGMTVYPTRSEGYMGDYLSLQIVAQDIPVLLERVKQEVTDLQ